VGRSGNGHYIIIDLIYFRGCEIDHLRTFMVRLWRIIVIALQRNINFLQLLYAFVNSYLDRNMGRDLQSKNNDLFNIIVSK